MRISMAAGAFYPLLKKEFAINKRAAGIEMTEKSKKRNCELALTLG